MVTFWAKAAHSVDHMLSLYFDNFPVFVFRAELCLIEQVSGHCILITFINAPELWWLYKHASSKAKRTKIALYAMPRECHSKILVTQSLSTKMKRNFFEQP